jgi:hypothetical protein
MCVMRNVEMQDDEPLGLRFDCARYLWCFQFGFHWIFDLWTNNGR